jgi:coatomer protein complex subunit alpha (xenin)
MKVRYDVRTSRVKGLCFHPSLPWLLASLHNGSIHLYDIYAKRLLWKFEEHEGPVRGLDIHKTQPLFASGGDDFKIKLWNLNERRCLYTFTNHTDYIRTVQFHWDLPWILSASDDQTIRIFNWQNRSCIAMLTGHSHYVMSAFFNLEEELIVSSSLDESVRIWDYSELKKKYSSSQGSGSRPSELGSTDVTVKIIMDGHEKPVNWAAFHPKKRLVVSSADDKMVRVWRYQDTRAWELETLSGHCHNVVACAFHPNYDLVLSASEDKTLRIWDYNTKAIIDVVKRDCDRFWVIACHPNLNYYAAGHDSGLFIAKIESEKPGHVRISSNTVCYTSKHDLCLHDLSVGKSTPLYQFPPGERPLLNHYPKFLHYNQFDTATKAIMFVFKEGHRYYSQVYALPGAAAGSKTELKNSEPGHAVFISRDKVCVFKNKEVMRLLLTS